MSDAAQNRRAIHERLTNPHNAVPDPGIDLKRPDPKFVPAPRRVAASPPPEPRPQADPAAAIADLEYNIELVRRRIERLHAKRQQLRERLQELIAVPEPEPEFKAYRRIILIEKIQRLVAQKTGVSIADICSDRRTKAEVRARHLAMYLARILTSRSSTEIGRKFGDRDHSTVLNAIARIERKRAADPEFCRQVSELIKILNGGEQ